MTHKPDTDLQLRVLIVDDSVDSAEALSLLLTVMGCATAVAFGGAQGLAEADRFAPHLAFIDLEMPEMGGCEVAERLKANRRTSAVNLVCLTGRGQPDDRQTCLAAGFDDFFTKPLTHESLARVVAAANAALQPQASSIHTGA